MSFVKVQRVCWCVQCEEMLPRRCTKCVKHPDRKPRVVEIFDAPPVLATNECGCVKIRCQRPGCLHTMWRHPRVDGTLGNKNHFHDPDCVRIVTAAAKVAKRVTVICSCGCGRLVTRPMSNMKAKNVFFSQLCHFRWRVATAAKARREKDGADVQAFICYGEECRGEVVDHTRLPNGRYACVRCNNRVDEPSVRAENFGGTKTRLKEAV